MDPQGSPWQVPAPRNTHQTTTLTCLRERKPSSYGGTVAGNTRKTNVYHCFSKRPWSQPTPPRWAPELPQGHPGTPRQPQEPPRETSGPSPRTSRGAPWEPSGSTQDVPRKPHGRPRNPQRPSKDLQKPPGPTKVPAETPPNNYRVRTQHLKIKHEQNTCVYHMNSIDVRNLVGQAALEQTKKRPFPFVFDPTNGRVRTQCSNIKDKQNTIVDHMISIAAGNNETSAPELSARPSPIDQWGGGKLNQTNNWREFRPWVRPPIEASSGCRRHPRVFHPLLSLLLCMSIRQANGPEAC